MKLILARKHVTVVFRGLSVPLKCSYDSWSPQGMAAWRLGMSLNMASDARGAGSRAGVKLAQNAWMVTASN